MPFIDEGAIGTLTPELTGLGSLRVHGAATGDLGLFLEGDLVRPVFVARARSLSSTRIRIDFTRPVLVESTLTSPSNYLLEALDDSVVPTILSIDPPLGEAVSHVELIVAEMTDGSGNYRIRAGETIRDVSGNWLAAEWLTFDGVGVAPAIRAVLAESATTARVHFTEPIADIGDLRTQNAYSFDAGLTVERIVEIDVDSVLLQTSEQTEGELYTFTFTGAIFDYAGNEMPSPFEVPMLGYISKLETPPLLRLSMYNFLLDSIRQKDKEAGNEFLLRYLAGPQAIWSQTVESIFSLPKLWSLTECPDEIVANLGPMVGWSQELEHITEALDVPTARRLFSVSAAFWRQRGPEEAIEDILRLTTGARVYVLNWFDLRWVLNESTVGYVQDWSGGYGDTMLLSEKEQRTYNVRIVDDGKLNRELVRSLVKLTRPTGERIDLTYLGFLDRFETAGDLSQWDVSSAPAADVSDGALTIGYQSGELQEAFVNVPLAEDWSSYFVNWQILGRPDVRLEFYRTGPDDMYFVQLTGEAVTLNKRVGGVETNIGWFSTSIYDYDVSLVTGKPYMISVAVTPNTPGSSTSNIRVYVGERIVIDVLDADHAQGSIGIAHGNYSTMECRMVEMFFLPSTAEYIDINS